MTRVYTKELFFPFPNDPDLTVALTVDKQEYRTPEKDIRAT